jgi:hypothetical protein
MKFRPRWILSLAAASVFPSCAQRLPDLAEIDRSYQKVEEQSRNERADLERQRASGRLTESDYQREKAALENRISQRAIAMVWNRHLIKEVQMENAGIPTPDAPQDIAVPEAGSLPTGSDFRRFNQQLDSSYGTTGETVSGMREMMGRSTLGTNVRGHQSSGY